ncbi:MAG: transglutaminase protein [Sphingomonas bacterium]|nr:transglutaminase family protein [Sphingomonas bacterium]MDB5689592.1 transglutaminase protein [Sphingomonas bacterium]
MRLFIEHRTVYRFSEPQSRLVQLLRMSPGSHAGQNVVEWRIDVDCDARLKPGRDGFGNETHMLYIGRPIDYIGVTVTGEVLTEDRVGMLSGTSEPLPAALFLQRTRCSNADEAIRDFARELAEAGGSRLSQGHRLNEALHDRLRLIPGRHRGSGDAAAVFAEGEGSYSDLVHVFLAAARTTGIPARYVSGHLFRPEAENELHETAHGWAEAWVDGMGWIGFDPSAGRCPDDGYVRVATGLDYRDAAPLSGARIGGGEEAMEVGVRVGLTASRSRH